MSFSYMLLCPCSDKKATRYRVMLTSWFILDGDHAELLHHAQHVYLHPMLNALVIHYAVDINSRNLHMLIGWGNAHKGTLLRSAYGNASHYLVLVSDHVLNREVQIGESRQEHTEDDFGTRNTAWCIRRGKVIDLIGGDECLYGSHILLVNDFIIEVADSGLVVFC